MKKQVLVVTDDLEMGRSIQDNLRDNGMDMSLIVSMDETKKHFMDRAVCLIIMDVSSNGQKALEILRTMRETMSAPILALTDREKSNEKIALFQAGANVCLEKPIDFAVCMAQVKSLIQFYLESQTEICTSCPLIFGSELMIDPAYHNVIIDGESLILTRKEFDLLLCLARHPGQIWSRTQLYQYVWKDDLGLSGENTVRSHIGNLRKKLTEAGKSYIQNCWGVGYKFIPPTSS